MLFCKTAATQISPAAVLSLENLLSSLFPRSLNDRRIVISQKKKYFFLFNCALLFLMFIS